MPHSWSAVQWQPELDNLIRVQGAWKGKCPRYRSADRWVEAIM
ncbi:hypothetical protein M068_4568 [Bacteroides fragilis str. J38-1]|nr:hypothetical protein M068_4568 [Bacteroides fragilis str. J38-1]